MKTVMLNDKALKIQSIKLPLLIHGKDKSGASYFTMNMVLQMLAAGEKVLFYSAFQPARDFLIDHLEDSILEVITSSTNSSSKQLVIPMSGEQKLLKSILSRNMYLKHIVIVKNVELLDAESISLLGQRSNVVYSGDSRVNAQLELPPIASTIVFSDLETFNTSDIDLDQYQGYYVGKGIVELVDM